MSIEIRGLDKLYRKLGKIQGTQVLERPMQRGLLRLQRRMQEYPPAVPATPGRRAYRRTGTYGRRWVTRVDKSGGGLVGRVGNNVAYGPYVGSERFQARVHAGRWPTDARVVREEQAGIVADFQREIDRALTE